LGGKIKEKKMDDMGMTNEQYKGMLLENWKEVYNLAKLEGATKAAEKAEKQINKINEKLKF